MRNEPVVRSKPNIRRGLLLSAGLFILLVLATLAVVAHLIFQDLSRQVVTRNLLNSLSEVKKQWLEAEGKEHPRPEGEGGISRDLGNQIPLPQPPPAVPPKEEPQYRRTIRGVREITTIRDAGGNVVGRTWTTRVIVQMEAVHQEAKPPYDKPVEEVWDLGGNKKQKMLTLHEPVDPVGKTIAEVGIPIDQVEETLRPLRRSLIAKTLVGAGVTLVILGCAFAYVLHLIQKTRRLEAEAQVSDRRAHVATLAREMAHEIRNPLNAMSMNLEMLEEELAGRLAAGEEVGTFLAGIKGEIRRLKDLADNFLSYARPPLLTLDGHDLNRFLEEVCSFVEPEARARKIALLRDFDPMLPSVEFDSAQLRQAVLNILSNAQQVVPEGGFVRVRTNVSPEGEIRISISDSGPGMTPEVLENIFQPFYSSRQGGTGLGLPIARRAVEAHGGRIEVESEPGHGSTFHVLLPRRQGETLRGAETAGVSAWPAAAEGGDGLRQAR